MTTVHEETGHYQMAPQDTLHHLLDQDHGHGMRSARVGELTDAVTDAELAYLRWQTDANTDDIDRVRVVHDAMHREAEGPQAVWEHAVRVELVQRGFDPRLVEVEAEGFGQDFFEYEDAPVEFVDAVLDEFSESDLAALRIGG